MFPDIIIQKYLFYFKHSLGIFWYNIFLQKLFIIPKNYTFLYNEKTLNKYISKIKYSSIKPFKKFAKILNKYLYDIVDYTLHLIHTLILEGLINKLKENKITFFGYHDLDYFKLKVKQYYPEN